MVKYRSTKLRQRRKKEFWLKLSLIIIVLLCLVFSVSKIFGIERINITQFKISGNEVVSSESVQDEVTEIMSGNYLKLFSKSNFLIYPKQDIEETLLTIFPRFNEVDLNVDNFNILKIDVVERNPYVLFCEKGLFENEKISSINVISEETDESIAEETVKLKERCLFVDNTGFVFDKAPNFPKEIFFKYYVGMAGEESLGKFAFEGEKFKELDSFIQFLNGLGLSPYKLEIEKENYEIYFAENSRLIFEIDQDIKEVTTNLQSVLNMEDFEEEGSLWNIEYIDLRFGNKVFYKIK